MNDVREQNGATRSGLWVFCFDRQALAAADADEELGGHRVKDDVDLQITRETQYEGSKRQQQKAEIARRPGDPHIPFMLDLPPSPPPPPSAGPGPSRALLHIYRQLDGAAVSWDVGAACCCDLLSVVKVNAARRPGQSHRTAQCTARKATIGGAEK